MEDDLAPAWPAVDFFRAFESRRQVLGHVAPRNRPRHETGARGGARAGAVGPEDAPFVDLEIPGDEVLLAAGGHQVVWFHSAWRVEVVDLSLVAIGVLEAEHLVSADGCGDRSEDVWSHGVGCCVAGPGGKCCEGEGVANAPTGCQRAVSVERVLSRSCPSWAPQGPSFAVVCGRR